MNKYSTISLSLFLIAFVSPVFLAHPILMAGIICAVISVIKFQPKWVGISLIALNLVMLIFSDYGTGYQRDLYKRKQECLSNIDRSTDIAGVHFKLKEFAIEEAEKKCNEMK